LSGASYGECFPIGGILGPHFFNHRSHLRTSSLVKGECDPSSGWSGPIDSAYTQSLYWNSIRGWSQNRFKGRWHVDIETFYRSHEISVCPESR
jgi:hypothetical protein